MSPDQPHPDQPLPRAQDRLECRAASRCPPAARTRPDESIWWKRAIRRGATSCAAREYEQRQQREAWPAVPMLSPGLTVADRARLSPTEPDRARQSPAEPDRARQSPTEPDRARQPT
eukprot:1063412-Prymnesium_polylepis.2